MEGIIKINLKGALLRFLVVGSTGFFIDAILFYLAIQWAELGVFLARLISFPIAMTATWALNRFWTFESGQSKAPRRQYVSYVYVQMLGVIINQSIFVILVTIGGLWLSYPVLSLTVGSATSAVFTFFLFQKYVFS